MRVWATRFLLAIYVLLLCGCHHHPVRRAKPIAVLNEQGVGALNSLRDSINAEYGFREGVPRVNLGPCGRVAKEFREQWRARFRQPVNIAFVMSLDGSICQHVLVRLPDGNYFDGGNGVVSGEKLMQIYATCRIEEMVKFNLKLLDKRSYGLAREYPSCANYSDEKQQD